MNANYISRALCFHGQPMQKIWEDEHGTGDLQKMGVPLQPDYSIYQERQKHFTFQDRAKRLKLHQFFARKASDLYDKELVAAMPEIVVQPNMAVLPPYEVFVNTNQDKTKRWRSVLEIIKPGDIVYGVIAKTKSLFSMTFVIKPLCTAEPLVRFLSDIPLKAYCQAGNAPVTLDNNGKPRSFQANDFVCCEVVEISIDADRLTLSMKSELSKNKNIQLGLINAKDLPQYYRCVKMGENMASYEEYLENSKEFQNPNYDILYEINGLSINDTFSLMPSLKYQFPSEVYVKQLRQAQASKWAFRAVAEGIEHFKIGNQIEAFQCLNKALNIDPRNVEGLVARGALYANKGSFLKAVEDFEKALNINEFHINARKYMGETLVALGRSYEEENRIQDAIKAYSDCLKIIPNHEQARLSLDSMQQRPGNQVYDMYNISENTVESGKNKKKRNYSSSSSSDDSSSEEESTSSESEKSGALSFANFQNQKKNMQRNKEPSLSPLSKRMALHAASLEAAEIAANQPSFNQPFYMSSSCKTNKNAIQVPTNVNEFKLDDDDTETRVRKLLQEASRHKKEKSKKSKKKKSKKSKKDHRKEKDAVAILEKINIQEAYKSAEVISDLKIESKLNEHLQMYEKSIAEIKQRQEELQQSTSASCTSSHQRSETPPPKAPSMKIDESQCPSPPKFSSSYSLLSGSTASAAEAATQVAAPKEPQQPKLSFQIRKPVKVDKFGLVRIATPLTNELKSPTVSPKKSRSRSRSRRRRHSSSRRSRSNDSYRRRHRSRSRSLSCDRRRRRRSRSYSRSRSTSRDRRRTSRRESYSRGDRRNYNRRRTPSPFVPRDGPSRRRRSRSYDSRRRNSPRSPHSSDRQNFGNRVWQRPGFENNSSTSKKGPSSPPGGSRWLHDKFDDGPSIEEIDEIINQAQKERKQEIINRDKNILKKSGGGKH